MKVKIMDSINEYQEWTRSTVDYDITKEGDILTADVASRIGVLYKDLRDYHEGYSEFVEVKANIKQDIGDIMWTICRYADFYGWKMSDILDENIKEHS